MMLSNNNKYGLQESKLGVGKSLGEYTWLHTSAVKEIDIPNKDAILSLMDEQFCVVRISKKNNDFQLSQCPNFDTEREPSILSLKTFTITDNTPVMLNHKVAKTTNVQIFHHKHLFTPASYTGFDREKSIAWSEQWKITLPRTREITSRIGRINAWTEILKQYELPTQEHAKN